ncbi:MAG: hypothetical protein MUD11_01490 [Rhodobacteraceae bacterium]|jgi:hypothetical protein|nr:hypothetical protein [Paracoccaceae bacterium]
MKKFAIALALVAATSGAAVAGGPVINVDPVDPPQAGSVGSGPIVGVIAGLVLLGLLAGGGSSATTTAPGA